MSEAASVAVVGGGITGLTAAFRLQRAGVPVTLYEAGGRVGGVIQTVERDGYLAEFGPNTLLETSPLIAALVEDLGLEPRYSNPSAEARYLVRNGRLVPMPGSPLAFLGSGLFSWRAKLRLCREPFIAPAPADREESLAEFVVRRLGREFLDYAINPFVAGVYAGDPAHLSVRHAFPRLLALERNYGSLIKGQVRGGRERRRRKEVSKDRAPKFSFAGGLQTLTDAIGVRLGDSIRLNSRVTGLRQSGAGWAVVVEGGAAVEHRAVLLSSPAHKLAELEIEGGGGPFSLGLLREIHHPPVSSVVLGFRREDVGHALDGFGVLIPEVEGLRILGTIFSSSLFSGRAPAGHVTLTSYVGGMRAPELAVLETDRLVELVLKDLGLLLGVKGPPTFTHRTLFPRAIPQYDVGYGRFKDCMDDLERRAPGLFLAGHFRDGISLGDSIVSGQKISERIAGFLGRGAG